MVCDWLRETQTFFFEGVVHGWAGGNDGSPLFPKGKEVTGLEDWREALWRDGLGFQGYELADRWGTDQFTGMPSGQIVITHYKIPVWAMWIGGGSYDAQVTGFLRRALMESYLLGEFNGGRGRAEFEECDLRYLNEFTGDFQRFRGKERVFRIFQGVEKECLGSHEYWGGSLLYLGK